MKKLVLIAILALVPFTAFAIETMDDSSLDGITAQEGVTITFENVEISQQSSDMSWGDDDGIGGTTEAGYIFIASAGDTTTTISRSLTIDVATTTEELAVGGDSIAAGKTFIRIGLPSISQRADAKTMGISLGTSQTAAGESLGTLWQNGGNSSISENAAVYIYAH